MADGTGRLLTRFGPRDLLRGKDDGGMAEARRHALFGELTGGRWQRIAPKSIISSPGKSVTPIQDSPDNPDDTGISG